MKQLSFLDRYLTLWIALAMLGGVALGQFAPGWVALLSGLQSGQVNAPLAVGLILMMYPPLCKVRYEALARLTLSPRAVGLTLLLNWVVAPLVMLALAWLLLPDMPEYAQGLVLVGIAPCIAMVLVWVDLSDGNGELAAALVALNSLLQIALFSLYAWVFLAVVPAAVGLPATLVHISISEIAQTVLLYLGTPLAMGFVTRQVFLRLKGEEWFRTVFLPRISPLTLIALLATIVIMFSLKGELIVALPVHVLRVAVPLVVFFTLQFGMGYVLSRRLGCPLADRATVAFTASGNNFELAIAVAIAVFGLQSPQALASVVGPLVEVPVLYALARWVRSRE